MFPSTTPADGTSGLMRVSAFHRQAPGADTGTGASAGATRLSSLNPSLLLDLQRFAAREPASDRAGSLEVLEVMAAAVRHARALRVHLQHEHRVLPLAVFPVEHLVQTPVPLATLLSWRLTELRVLHVEPAGPVSADGADAGAATPAITASPVADGADGADPDGAAAGSGPAEVTEAPEAAEATQAPPATNDDTAARARTEPLGPLLWALALRGAREELLPEIAGSAAYRVAPGADLSRLALTGALEAAVQRLARHTTNLREIAGWPGFDRGRAMRLLNGLYLQAALMVSRSHPAATNEGWSPGGAER